MEEAMTTVEMVEELCEIFDIEPDDETFARAQERLERWAVSAIAWYQDGGDLEGLHITLRP